MPVEEILREKVLKRFGIKISQNNLTFVDLNQDQAQSLEPKNYPTFTLIWQALASIQVCIHAYHLQPCEIFVDTMGVGYAYPFIRLLFGCKIYSYTHYPIISSDMIKTVSEGTQQFNNKDVSPLKSSVKQVYYQILIFFYKWAGYFADEVAANSSWTRGHCDDLWNKGSNIDTLYPPCDTSEFIKRISLDPKQNPRENNVISFAQFRPEKDHMLQLAVWKECLDT
jgi:alpha-1,2-mannosyltransferase